MITRGQALAVGSPTLILLPLLLGWAVVDHLVQRHRFR